MMTHPPRSTVPTLYYLIFLNLHSFFFFLFSKTVFDSFRDTSLLFPSLSVEVLHPMSLSDVFKTFFCFFFQILSKSVHLSVSCALLDTTWSVSLWFQLLVSLFSLIFFLFFSSLPYTPFSIPPLLCTLPSSKNFISLFIDIFCIIS